METPLSVKTEIGLRVDAYLEQKHVNLPLSVRFIYQFDQVQFEKWCQEHKYLQEGLIVCLGAKGIRIFMLGMQSTDQENPQTDTVGFLMNDGEHDIKLPLLEREITFIAHREPVNKQEWSVSVEDFHARLNPNF